MKKYFSFLRERELNLVLVVILCLSLSIGFFIEFLDDQIPCALCFLQRIAMMGIAFSLYLNLLFGVSSRHYGFSLVWALFGMACSLRHIALNVCKPIVEGTYLFGPYRLYTWSFLVFFLAIFGIAVLLCLNKKVSSIPIKQKKDVLIYTAASLLIVMLSIGFFSVLQKQGWEW